MIFNNFIPWIALGISFLTMVITYIKFGREVHIDDKREMLSQLQRCKDQCDEIKKNYEKIKQENDGILSENRRLREENYRLMQRLTINGIQPPKGKP